MPLGGRHWLYCASSAGFVIEMIEADNCEQSRRELAAWEQPLIIAGALKLMKRCRVRWRKVSQDQDQVRINQEWYQDRELDVMSIFLRVQSYG